MATADSELGGNYQDFLNAPYDQQRHLLLNQSGDELMQQGFNQALSVFRQAARIVPAYQDFLQKHRIDPEKIVTPADFAAIPPITKKNYLREYPLHDLCWNGKLDGMNVVSVSSGSTGKPFLWPRNQWQEKEVDFWYSLALQDQFQVPEQRSLLLICFAIGMYIAGPFTFASCLRYGQRGHPLTLACPGNNPDATLKIIRELWDEYDQIIIGGYPPLVKDIVDMGVQDGIDWSKKSVKLFFGGEGYSEHWRDYVHSQLGHPRRTGATVNMYGTADSAILGIETPSSIVLRSLSESTEARLQFFEDERLPSVLSYHPLLKYFEADSEQNLFFTAGGGVPLVRYEIGDQGGLISYERLRHLVQDTSGRSLEDHLADEGFSHLDLKLPLVYLFGRKDFTVQLYGANVYPENIKEALEDPALEKLVTGKFIMTIEHLKNMTPFLQIRVQCQEGATRNTALRSTLAAKITRTLRQRNSEYEVIYNTIHEGAIPHIILDAYHHPDYTLNIKHRWVR